MLADYKTEECGLMFVFDSVEEARPYDIVRGDRMWRAQYAKYNLGSQGLSNWTVTATGGRHQLQPRA